MEIQKGMISSASFVQDIWLVFEDSKVSAQGARHLRDPWSSASPKYCAAITYFKHHVRIEISDTYRELYERSVLEFWRLSFVN